MDINDYIEQISEDLTFDSLEHWCKMLNIYYELPTDDDIPDWDDDIRLQIGNALKIELRKE